MKLGLVVALKAEARSILGRGRWESAAGMRVRSLKLGDGSEITAALSGVGMENAAVAASMLVEAGAGVLLSVGIAGGLSPDVRVGDLVIAGDVINGGEGAEQRSLQADREIATRARAVLPATGVPVHAGTIISTARPVLTAKDKAALFSGSRALSVDMESAAVAAVAAHARIPFFVMRAVSDGSGDFISRELYECLDREDGGVSLFELTCKVLGRPSMVKEIFHMRKGFNAALKVLGQGWRTLVKEGVFLSA